MPSPELILRVAEELTHLAGSSAARKALGDWAGTNLLRSGMNVSSAAAELGELAAKAPTSIALSNPYSEMYGVGYSTIREFTVARDGIIAAPVFRSMELESDSLWSKIFGLRDAVVRVSTANSTGTGFLIDDELAVTADHVIADKAENAVFSDLSVRMSDGAEQSAHLLARAPQEDLALMRIPALGNHAPRLELIDFSNLAVSGEEYAIGYPDGKLMSYLTKGKFSNAYIFQPEIEHPSNIANSVAWVNNLMPAWSGSSGSPFITQSGKVFGMAAKSDFVSSTYGPLSDQIMYIFQQLRGRFAERGWIEFASSAELNSNGKLEFKTVSSRIVGN